MTRREEAMIMLEAIDERAPTNVDWNDVNVELWIKALVAGFDRIKKSQSGAADRESGR